VPATGAERALLIGSVLLVIIVALLLLALVWGLILPERVL
jgi:hypothetical protein